MTSLTSLTPETCSECGGRSVEFSGSGIDACFRVCSRWREPGHMTKEDILAEIRVVRNSYRPSGRQA